MKEETQNKQKIIFLKGRRVNLRLLTEDDVSTMIHWVNDQEVTQFVTMTYPMTIEQEIEYVKSHTGRTDKVVFGIETKEGVYIGNMGIDKIDQTHRTAITGAIIGNKEYWGKGYGSEAKMLLLSYAFNTLNLRKICSSAIAFNERSINYQKKTGAVVEGVRKDQLYKNGQYYDEVLLAVFKENWLPVWDKYQKTGRV